MAILLPQRVAVTLPHSDTSWMGGTFSVGRSAPTSKTIMDALSTKFTGQPLKRLEDPRLLRGQACFVDDLRLPDVRHVAFVRSMHPHARFRVDASAATAVSGVVAVFTAMDFEGTSAFREIPTVVPHPALRPC